MISGIAFLALAWLPLWAIALWRRREIRFTRVAFGAVLVGFIGGACAVELRRHGFLAALADSPELPLFGFRPDEVLHFAHLGAAGGLIGEILLGPAQEPSERS